MGAINIINKITALDCQVLTDVPLADFTTFKIGGKCKAVVKPNTITAVKPLISLLKENDIEYYFLGNGSNMLASSQGFDGVIILLSSNVEGVKLVGGDTIVCEAGISLTRLCRFAKKNSLAGLEFAFGIPGTVGGAVYMNAGAYGGEMKDVLSECTFLDEEQNIVTLSADDLDFSYRHSFFSDKKMCILSMKFKLEIDNIDKINALMEKNMNSRIQKQPLDFPSAGSTFKRPAGNYASALIEKCGLKGCKCGGAMVSPKHAGFVINTGGATSDDVLNLIKKVQAVVLEQTGYLLECEMKTIGG